MPEVRARVHLALVALGAIALQLPIYDRWLPYFDEAFIYQIADEIRRGAVMYRDVAHVAFPGVFHLMAAVFWLAGPSVIVGRWVAVALFTIAAMLVYRLARSVLDPRWALLAAAAFVLHRPWAFPQWQMMHYSTLAVTLLLAAALVVVEGLPSLRPSRLFGAGLLFGLAVLSKQDYGGAALVAINLFLLVAGRVSGGRRLRALATLDAGGALPLALAAGWFAAHGALGDLVDQCIVAPLVVKQLWRAGAGEYITFFGLRPWLHQNPILHSVQAFNYLPPLLIDLYFIPVLKSWLFQQTIVVDSVLKLVFLLPAILIVANAVSLWRRPAHDAQWWRECWLTVFAAGMLAAYNKPRDWAHLVPIAVPAFVLGTLVMSRAVARGGWRRWAIAAPAALAGTGAAAVGIWLLVGLRARYDTRLDLPRAGVRLEASEVAVFRDLGRWLDDTIGRDAPVPVYPYHPAVNFVLGRDGVGRYRTIEPVAGSPTRDAEVIAALDRVRPPAVVFAYKELVSQPRFAVYAAPLHAYLLQHYTLGPVFSCAAHRCIFGVLVPRPARKEIVIADLTATAADAILSVRDAAGDAPAPEGRAALVATTSWSYFAPVLALHPLPAGQEVRLAFPAPSTASRFRARVGVNPARWAEFEPGATTLGVSLVDAAGEHVLWQGAIDPERRYEDRPWRDVDVAVPAATAGARLVLWSRCDRPEGYPLEHAGFEAPRLVAPAAG